MNKQVNIIFLIMCLALMFLGASLFGQIVAVLTPEESGLLHSALTIECEKNKKTHIFFGGKEKRAGNCGEEKYVRIDTKTECDGNEYYAHTTTLEVRSKFDRDSCIIYFFTVIRAKKCNTNNDHRPKLAYNQTNASP